ncbi:hypothetical protein GCM10018965_079020 [Nonomuraea roseola]
MQRVHATLRAALNEAIREGLIDTNPAHRLRLPRTRRPHAQVWTRSRVSVWRATGQRPAVAVWTTEHLTEFLDYVREDALYPLWWLAALRGLRRGELAGLRWLDVSLETRELTVVQQLIHVNGRLRVVPPKSEASQRTIALDTEAIRLLRRHQQLQHLSGLGTAGWVFTREDGQPIRPDYLTYRFRYLVAASGQRPAAGAAARLAARRRLHSVGRARGPAYGPGSTRARQYCADFRHLHLGPARTPSRGGGGHCTPGPHHSAKNRSSAAEADDPAPASSREPVRPAERFAGKVLWCQCVPDVTQL